ncbi:MAG TPA: phosphate ABC transporter substrate-binding protein PstS [Thermoleophilia bacterium]|nr:phosphate ABC transporter substrate-binding protein PstS [Thermoleophilia bacterium]
MKQSKRGRLRVAGFAVAAFALAITAAACGGSNSSSSTVPGSVSSSPAASASPTLTPVPLQAGTNVGAGATFPAPIYLKWGSDYNAAKGVKLNYQAIGSGGGIAAIEAKLVNFGATDAPLQEADLTANNLAQFPMIVGGDVVVVHLNGVADGQLKLTPDVLASIFMGKTTMWNDPSIVSLNPGLTLPATKITVVHRSDSSGTTWIFTHYLTAAAPSVWTAGADKVVPWPVGIGGNGSAGVATSVQQLSGSIGYVEYAYAKQTGMTTTQLQNKAGNWVKPSIASFSAAAANANWKASLPSMYVVLVNQPGADSWPITGASFILVQKSQTDAAIAKQMFDWFNWNYTSGASAATALDYVPIPASVYSLIQKQVWPTVTASGSPVWP